MRQITSSLACILGISVAVMAYGTDDAELRPLSPELREKCLSVLHKALEGDEFWPAMHAAEALTLAGEGKSVVPLLEARLKTDEDAQHRCGLAREIVRTGKREPLTILWQTLADTKSTGRVHAAESLYKIGEVGDGKLLRAAMQDKENPKLQIMAAAALGRAGNQQALGLVREKLKSDDPELRKLAAWVLGLLGNSEDIPAIRRLRDTEADPVTQSFFVNALACLGEAKARETLAKNIDSADPAIRTYAADFAAWSRNLDAVKADRLSDPNVDVRVRTAQALLVFSLPRHVLGLPLAAAGDDIQVDVFLASAKFPRYSEGSLIPLHDGSLLYATTEFVGGGADHATASIVAKTSTNGGRTWSEQRTLQENIGKQNVMSVTLRRLPPGDDMSPLGMFFLQKNSPSDLRVLLRISHDDGKTFGEPIAVSSGPGYHIMNNDRVTLLSSGRLICPISWTDDIFKKGSHLVCYCSYSDDGGLTWKRSADQVDQPGRGAMEPEVVELASGKLLMIIRTQMGYIATSTSDDGGDHWSAPGKLPLDAPESPATIRTIPATGDLLLVWNNTFDMSKGHGGDRTPLSSAISSDGGKTWSHVRNLETDRQHTYAYTSLLFHKDRVLLSYYVSDNKSDRISSRFRSLPVRWFYEGN